MKTLKLIIKELYLALISKEVLIMFLIISAFLGAKIVFAERYELQFNLLDRKRVQPIELKSKFMSLFWGNKNIGLENPVEYDFEEMTRRLCSIEGTSMEIYNDIGTLTTYCGIPVKGKDWTYQDYFWSANSHLRKTAKIITDIYGNVSSEAMEGLLSWDYNTPQTRPAIRNKDIIEAVKVGNKEFVREYMKKYNTPQNGHKGRREMELNLIFI